MSKTYTPDFAHLSRLAAEARGRHELLDCLLFDVHFGRPRIQAHPLATPDAVSERLPNYSGSIDDALELLREAVPEMRLIGLSESATPGRWNAMIGRRGPPPKLRLATLEGSVTPSVGPVLADAASPALAICLAVILTLGEREQANRGARHG